MIKIPPLRRSVPRNVVPTKWNSSARTQHPLCCVNFWHLFLEPSWAREGVKPISLTTHQIALCPPLGWSKSSKFQTKFALFCLQQAAFYNSCSCWFQIGPDEFNQLLCCPPTWCLLRSRDKYRDEWKERTRGCLHHETVSSRIQLKFGFVWWRTKRRRWNLREFLFLSVSNWTQSRGIYALGRCRQQQWRVCGVGADYAITFAVCRISMLEELLFVACNRPREPGVWRDTI